MHVPKGYRAREDAAKKRRGRKLAPDHIRAARLKMLPDNVKPNVYDAEPAAVEVAAVEEPVQAEVIPVVEEAPAVEAVAEKHKKVHKNKAK